MTQDKIDKLLWKNISATDRALAKQFIITRKEVQSQIALLYEKYSTDGILTYAEMSKYNRLDSLYKSLGEDLRDMGYKTSSLTKGLVKENYEGAFYEYGQNINEQIGTKLNFGLVNKDAVKSLIMDPNVSGESLATTLTKSRYKLLLKQRQTITQGFIQGESYAKMAKRISKEFNIGFNDSVRIARTEAHRAAGEGQADVYDKAEKYVDIERIWLTGGANIRDAHQALDHKKANKKGIFTIPSGLFKGSQTRYAGGFGVAALNINCKCRIASKVKKIS